MRRGGVLTLRRNAYKRNSCGIKQKICLFRRGKSARQTIRHLGDRGDRTRVRRASACGERLFQRRRFLREPTGTFGEFAEDGGAGGEAHRLTGLAYHAFLQYADFAFLHAGGGATADLAAAERERMKKRGCYRKNTTRFFLPKNLRKY